MKPVKLLFILFGSVLISFSQARAANEENTRTENQIANQHCFKCHGSSFFTYENSVTEKTVRKKMEPGLIIDSTLFYLSNHKTFKCTDCHSEDFATWPHSPEVRMEATYNCNDCHAGDDHYAKFQFEKIEEEFNASTHATKIGESFTCWACHEPHTYRISARTEENIKMVVAYDNNICLSCHSNINRYQLLSDQENPNVIAKHDWLPSQARHFKSVRCIECHADRKDSILVNHNILPKEQAVKRCRECHSKNSILMNTLYRHEAKSSAAGLGFDNDVILNSSYVIGANRNIYLNQISIAIFILVLAGLFVHTLLRIFLKK